MTTRYSADSPPPKTKGWNHSDRVLVWYEGAVELGTTDTFGIAYYHYKPPFRKEGEWVDWDNHDRIPSFWWVLPETPIK